MYLRNNRCRGNMQVHTRKEGKHEKYEKSCCDSRDWVQAPQTASMSMADEGGRARSLSLERQHSRFLRGEKYIGFHDEPMHREATGSLPLEVSPAATSNLCIFCPFRAGHMACARIGAITCALRAL